jgi:hypothetical protein
MRGKEEATMLMRGKEATITEMVRERPMPLMVYLHYNWPRERHSRPPHAPRWVSGGPLALTLARRGGKLPSVVSIPEGQRAKVSNLFGDAVS